MRNKKNCSKCDDKHVCVECVCDDCGTCDLATMTCKCPPMDTNNWKEKLADLTCDSDREYFVESLLAQQKQQIAEEERKRINQYFADKADYDVETDCTIISDRIYHKAFNPNGCESNGENGKNLCTDCYANLLSPTNLKE